MAYYQSVESLIITKASREPYSIAKAVVKKHLTQAMQDITLHEAQERQLTKDDKNWLGELWVWERLFPNDDFPGVRVANPDGVRVTTKKLSPCNACTEMDFYMTYGGGCPLTRPRDCPKGRHPPYEVRIGTDSQECPQCDEEGSARSQHRTAKRSGYEEKNKSFSKADGDTNATQRTYKRTTPHFTEEDEPEAHSVRKRQRFQVTMEDELEIDNAPFRGTVDQRYAIMGASEDSEDDLEG